MGDNEPKPVVSALETGFVPVMVKQGGETPPALVGATLSCLEVPLLAKGLKAGYDREADGVAQIAEKGAQYGLFLFGGDDRDNRQTDSLLVFYLQEHKWRNLPTQGRTPSKRSRHTASVVHNREARREQLLIFGGVGATNAISVLDSTKAEWIHPSTCSKPGEKEKARRRAKKSRGDENVSDSLLPCARFGHTAAVVEQQLFIFGGADFKGPLGAHAPRTDGPLSGP